MRKVALTLLLLSACSNPQNAISIFEDANTSQFYSSGSMHVFETRNDVQTFQSRVFSLQARGEFAVRYFWRSDDPLLYPEIGSKVPTSLSGRIKIVNLDESVVAQSSIEPTSWGNGMDILVFSKTDFPAGGKYRVLVEKLDLPSQKSDEAGTIELDLYFKHAH